MGGKKGGGGGHTPVEAPDSLLSSQRLSAIGIISLGPIKGPVNKWKSTYLDNTPIQNASGKDDDDVDSFNFTNMEIQYTLGTQDQLPMTGFDSSQREVPIGIEVKKERPITRSIIDPDVDRLRVTIGVNALFSQNDQGDTNGTSVEFEILINGNLYKSYSINGKSSSRFYRSYIIDELPPKPFNVTVRRVTADSKSQRLQNAIVWSSYTEIIDAKLSYPNIAMIGIKTDSRHTPNFPNVNSLLDGRVISVPSTYDPETRTYAPGIWRGDFKKAWTENPAWIFYDLATNPDVGIGKRISEYGLNKFQLYQIAQYCDELVPDGYGGKEPRMTAGIWITEQRSAYEVLNDMSSVFRAIVAWNGMQMLAIQDRPTDPVCTYSQANVIDGKFARQYVPLKSIYTAVEVEYADKNNMYQKAIEYVVDDEMVARYGYNVKKITAFACTSRGQARRYGKWVLVTSKLEQCTITFTVGREGLHHLPGDIIEVADNSWAKTNLGGRVVSINKSAVELDRKIKIEGDSYLSYVVRDNNGQRTERVKILSVTGNVVNLESVPENLNPDDNWALQTPLVRTELYRAIGVAENDGNYTITALQHEPQKQAIVDNSASFEPRNTTLHQAGVSSVSDAEVNADGSGISLSFKPPANFVGQGLKYQVKLYRDGNLFDVYDDLQQPALAFNDLPDGDYIAEIRSKNFAGQLSEPVTKSFSINFDIKELVTVSKVMGIDLNWRNPIFANTNAAIEIWVSQDDNFQHARKLVTLAYPTNSYSYTGLGAAETYYFWARMVSKDVAGKFTAAVVGVTERDATKIVDYIHGQISKSALTQELVGELTGTSQAANIAKNIAGNAVAKVLAEAQTRSTQINELKQVDERQAQAIRTVTVKADNALSDIVAEQKARADGDKANTEKITAVTARVGSAESTLTHLQSTKASKTEVAAIAQSALQSTWQADAKSAVDSVAVTLTNADRVLGQRIDSITSSLGDARAQISAVNQAVANANSALGQRIDTVSASLSNTDNLCFNPSMINDTSGWSGMWREFVDGLWSGLVYERDGLYGEPFPVRPGERFYVSMNSKNKDATYPIGIGLQMFRRDGSLFWPLACRREVNSSSTNWEKIDGYLTIPDNENIVSARLWIQVDKPWHVHHPGYWYVRNITFYRFTSLATERAMDDAKAQISAVSRAIAETNGKLSATHTIKTQVVAGGRTAIAGIALGASSDGRTAESSVIVMADKFGVVKNAGDGQVKPIFSIVNGSTALSGDLIADGSIVGRHIRANTELSAPNIKGGTITGNTINGTTVNGGTINGATVSGSVVKGSTIEGGVIKATRLEGVTGKFSGTLEVNSLIGSNILEIVTFNDVLANRAEFGAYSTPKYHHSFYRKINIAASNIPRIFYVLNSNFYREIPANQSMTIEYLAKKEGTTDPSWTPPEIFYERNKVSIACMLIALTSRKTLS